MSSFLQTTIGVVILSTALNIQAEVAAASRGVGSARVATAPNSVLTVNSIADTSDGVCDAANCTLREAIGAAQDGDIISFSTMFNTPQTILLQTALPNISQNITIQGTGANLLTVRRNPNAATNFRVFTTAGGFTVSVEINAMTISGGQVNAGEVGGGISASTQFSLSNVHVNGNSAGSGGGVYMGFASGSFSNCTFSNNTSINVDGSGGGIFFLPNGGNNLRVINSTISGNTATTAGGISVFSNSGSNTLEIINSTIANNSAGSVGAVRAFAQTNSTAATTFRNSIVAGNVPINLASTTNVGGTATFQSLGFNLSDNYNGVVVLQVTDLTANPLLGALQFNGGQTPTQAPSLGSLALDKGNASGTLTDQRGFSRPFDLPGIVSAAGGDGSDIGALEAQSLPLSELIFANGLEN